MIVLVVLFNFDWIQFCLFEFSHTIYVSNKNDNTQIQGIIIIQRFKKLPSMGRRSGDLPVKLRSGFLLSNSIWIKMHIITPLAHKPVITLVRTHRKAYLWTPKYLSQGVMAEDVQRQVGLSCLLMGLMYVVKLNILIISVWEDRSIYVNY